MGPLEKVILNSSDGNRYALVIFKDTESVIFASECLNSILLFGTAISVQPKGRIKNVGDLLTKIFYSKL